MPGEKSFVVQKKGITLMSTSKPGVEPLRKVCLIARPRFCSRNASVALDGHVGRNLAALSAGYAKVGEPF
jgi:hypothetical protein